MSQLQTGRARASTGQSLVEFTLVLPILLLLLLTVADFGRFFAAGITVESMARAAAEVAAREYLREEAAGGGSLSAAAYARVHAYAWQSICDEASDLAGVTTGAPSDPCSGVPTVVCVHDLSDPDCGNSYNDAGGIPAECPGLAAAARPTNAKSGGTETSRYVEVRVCYRFTTIMPIDIPSIGGPLSPLSGAFFIERSRAFTVADY